MRTFGLVGGVRQAGMTRACAAAFWIAVLFVLPNCTLDRSGTVPPENLERGIGWSDAIFCDIAVHGSRRCSTAADRENGIPLHEAAVALNDGRTSTIGLDFSDEALAHCGGQPEAIDFEGPFPQGQPVCLNCAEAIGTTETPDVPTACRQACYDLYGTSLAERSGFVRPDRSVDPNVPPADDVRAFCDANARPSVAMRSDGCFEDVCDSGTLRDTFVDPRREPEQVNWIDRLGTDVAVGPPSALGRSTPFTGNFDARAVSEQWIQFGDGWVEFSVSRSDRAVTVGLSEVPSGCAAPADCPDLDPGRTNIRFGLAMGPDGQVYVKVGSTDEPVPVSRGPYGAGERYRIRVTKNPGSNTATVSFARLTASCVPGTPCPQDVFYTEEIAAANYPLRMKAAFRDGDVIVENAQIVRMR